MVSLMKCRNGPTSIQIANFVFFFFGVFMYNETFINGVFEFTVTHKGENILTIRVPGREFSRVLAMRAVAQSMAEMAK